MNTNTKTVLAMSALIISIAAGFAVWNSGEAQAADRGDRAYIDWGITSLARGRTARLNVVGIGNPDTSEARRVTLIFDIYGQAPPDPDTPGCDGAAAACTNNLRFLRRETCQVTLMRREAASCDFTANGDDLSIHAAMLGGPDTTPTLEIREAGVPIFMVPAAIKRVDPSNPNAPGGQ